MDGMMNPGWVAARWEWSGWQRIRLLSASTHPFAPGANVQSVAGPALRVASGSLRSVAVDIYQQIRGRPGFVEVSEGWWRWVLEGRIAETRGVAVGRLRRL